MARLFLVAVALLVVGCARRVTGPTVPAAPAPTESEVFISTIERIKLSVVPVVCVAPGIPKWNLLSIEGTAFFVSEDGTFLTPNHVIQGIMSSDRKQPCQVPAIYVPEGGWKGINATNFDVKFIVFAAAKCATDDTADLALCTPMADLKGLTGHEAVPVTFETSAQPDGTPVAFTGFPLSRTMPMTSRGSIASHEEIRPVGGAFEMTIDKGAWPGASGSPVYLKSGRVIGIITQRGIGDGSGISIARTCYFIESFVSSTGRVEPRDKGKTAN